jgi:ferredoxin
MAVRLRVDPIRCDGFGHCAELAPELVVLDEWGYPILTEKPLSPRERRLAEDAMLQCPRKALFLDEFDERQVRPPRRR